MDDEQIWHLIAAYLAGESSEAEERELLAWASEDPEHRHLLDSARTAWTAHGELRARWDSRDGWASVEHRLKNREPVTAATGRRSFREPSRHRSRYRVAAAGIAALVVIGAIRAITWKTPTSPDEPVVLREVTTRSAQRKTVTLADGTQVSLAPDSRLGIPSSFATGEREVRLAGEAFFEVTHDPARPFTVVAGAGVARVLGTKFDVRAYPGDPKAQVVVAEGRVSLRPQVAIEREATVLTAGEMGEIAAGGDRVSIRRVDLDRYLGWRDGVLSFEDASLTQVAADLERWYGVPVRVAGASLVDRRLTATFRDQPIDEVMGVIAAALGIDYARSGKTYTFFPEGKLTALALARTFGSASSKSIHARE